MKSSPSYVPRVCVLSGNPGRWSAAQQSADHIENGVEAWVFAFKCDYIGHNTFTDADLKSYDIIIGNGNNPLKRLLRWASKRPASVKWVMQIEGNADSYIAPHPLFSELCNASNVVNCINEHSLPYFATLTTTPVRPIGIPYPIDEVKRFIVPYADRKRRTLICPMLLQRRTDYEAARRMGIDYYGYEFHYTRKGREIMRRLWNHEPISFDKKRNYKIAEALYNDPALTIRKQDNMLGYYQNNSDAMLWVNLDNRFTWARYVLDAAALQIPIITTPYTVHGPRLFPHTTVENEWAIDSAVHIGKRLIADREFYAKTIEYAAEKLNYYKAAPTISRLYSALGISNS